jgi:hypothetical protein
MCPLQSGRQVWNVQVTNFLLNSVRYRRPSLRTLLGVTKAKRQIKRDLGIYKVTKILNAPKNAERRLKRKAGYYSEPMKLFRFLLRLFK